MGIQCCSVASACQEEMHAIASAGAARACGGRYSEMRRKERRGGGGGGWGVLCCCSSGISAASLGTLLLLLLLSPLLMLLLLLLQLQLLLLLLLLLLRPLLMPLFFKPELWRLGEDADVRGPLTKHHASARSPRAVPHLPCREAPRHKVPRQCYRCRYRTRSSFPAPHAWKPPSRNWAPLASTP